MKASVALSFGFTVLAIAGLGGPALALEPQDADVWYTPRLEKAPDDVPPARQQETAATLPPCLTSTAADGLPACHLEERSRRGLVVGGAVLSGVPYALSVAFGIALADFQGGAGGKVTPTSFFVPVAGPFIILAEAGELVPLVLLDGLAQATGVAMMIAGVAWKQTMVVPHTSTRAMLTPARIGTSGHGLALVGVF